jgi:hypothetical protein
MISAPNDYCAEAFGFSRSAGPKRGGSRFVAAPALALALAGAAASGAQAAISFHSGQIVSNGQVADPGAAPGQAAVLDFNATGMPKGFTQINGAPGAYGLSTGDTNGVAAEPSGDSSQYFYVGTGGIETFLFPHAVASASFYWGTVDDYNFVDVLGGSANAPVVLATISGWQAVGTSVSSRHFGQSLRLYIADNASAIIGLRFRSYGQSFEIDNIAIDGPSASGSLGSSAAPEPAAWAMMILGLGGVGAMARRRQSKAATA